MSLLAGSGFFILFWTLYLLLFAAFDDRLKLGFHPLEDVEDD